MTAQQLDTLFASVPDLRWLDLTGGEVVARADIADIARSIHRRLPKLALLHFPTGGWFTDKTVAAAKVMRREGGPRLVITVSVDGPPALHDRIRGVSGAWDRAIKTLLALRAEGFETYPGMTLQAVDRNGERWGNVAAIDATVAALAQVLPGFRHRDLHVNVAHSSEHYFANTQLGEAPVNRVDATDRADVAAAIAAFARRKGAPHDPISLIEAAYLAMLPAHFRHGRSPIPCRSGELSAYISPAGEVFACTIDPRPIGELSDHGWSLARLWDTQRRKDLATDVRGGACVGCWTPCEAYQTLLASPVATGRGLLNQALT